MGVATAVEPLSPFTATVFNPDGNICEFINVAGDCQEYFVVDPLLAGPPALPNYGAIKAAATLTRGVFVRRDNSPIPGSVTAAGQTGFLDPPGALGPDFIPTGFNIGRVFASYNPDAYGGQDGGAYFLAMDISAPGVLDLISGTQPVAFDIDGNGSRLTATELGAPTLIPPVTDAPVNADKLNREGYTIRINTDSIGTHEITITIGEQVDTIPPGSVEINPNNAVQIISGMTVRRYVLFTDRTGLLPGTPQQQALVFLDANNDGVLDYRDFGVGNDIELAVRNVGLLPRNDNPACAIFTYIADSFDDEPLGGGGEDAVLINAQFPVPDIEVIKEARCLEDSDTNFRKRVNAVPGSPVEFRITIQNQGNRDLNVTMTDVLTCVSPATAALVPGSCTIVGPLPAGVPANFCQLFENAMNIPGGFPLAVGRLNAGDPCAVGLGEQLRFTFRVLTGPVQGNPALCDQAVDCTNAVSVSATMVNEVDPILPPDPPSADSPDGNSEEEDCANAACCVGIPGCVPNDGIGDVRDEFNVTVVDNANVIDTSREEAAAADNNVAEIELDCRELTFIKQVRRLGTATFVTGATPLNLPADPLAYPLTIEYRYTATNTGEDPESVTISDPNLCADVAAAPGVSFVACPLCPGGSIAGVAAANGGTFSTTCTVRFDDALSARNFGARDNDTPTCRDPDDLCYRNCATLSVPPASCDPGFGVDSFSTVCFVDECILNVAKSVRCLDNCPAGNPVGAAQDSVMTVPGGCSQFEIQVFNPGPVNIPLLCIDDDLTCTWTVTNVELDINGTAVTTNPPFVPNGVRQCVTIVGRPNGLTPGDTLNITFHVQVPASFAQQGTAVDCRNTVDVDGYKRVTDNTALPPDSRCTGRDSADIDVKVPGIDCGKSVAVDNGDNGSIDIDPTTSAIVATPVYPIRLTYALLARNTGELPMTNVQICDPDLVANAVAAGISVQNCALCTGACDGINDSCATVAVLGPGLTATRTCELVIASPEQWEDFAGRDSQDGRGDCYSNRMTSSGDIEPPCAPPSFPRRLTSRNCPATVCIPVIPGCPVTKARFDIWNQNEVRFSGTERCITSWDQELFSRYTPDNIANHLRRAALQTEKGKARIDGIESSVVCGTSSVSAPLLGVSAKIVNFGNRFEMAGRTLVGQGVEPGFIKYDLPPGPARARDGSSEAGEGSTAGIVLGDSSNRADVSVKGSLLVYTKVEIKWNAAFELIQDTFLDISNDFPQDVRVQLYLVNGDQPTGPVFDGDPPRLIERAHLGCNAVDNVIQLTGNEPTYWSAFTGNPKGVSPFTILDPGLPPGRPDTDPLNRGGRVLRGYVLAWAVDTENREIRWNHLRGDAMIVNYPLAYAWDYPTWNFPAIAGMLEGSLLLEPYGQLNLDGVEYAYAPDQLLMDFYAAGSRLISTMGQQVLLDTDLTLWAAVKDLRQP